MRPGSRRPAEHACMRWALVSIGWPGGTTVGVDYPTSVARPSEEGEGAPGSDLRPEDAGGRPPICPS